MNGKWYNFLFLFFGLLGFVFSLTLLFFCMRAVMDVGGYCAEGGPYQIEVHCPDGVAWMTPLSIFGLIIFGMMYFFNVTVNTFNFGYLFWSALFGALGWNFLDYGMFSTDSWEYGWIICGVVFWLMAFGPFALLVTLADELPFSIKSISDNLFFKIVTTMIQLAAIAAGIWLGVIAFKL